MALIDLKVQRMSPKLFVVTLNDERFDVFFPDGLTGRAKPAVYSCFDAGLVSRSRREAKRCIQAVANHLAAGWMK